MHYVYLWFLSKWVYHLGSIIHYSLFIIKCVVSHTKAYKARYEVNMPYTRLSTLSLALFDLMLKWGFSRCSPWEDSGLRWRQADGPLVLQAFNYGSAILLRSQARKFWGHSWIGNCGDHTAAINCGGKCRRTLVASVKCRSLRVSYKSYQSIILPSCNAPPYTNIKQTFSSPPTCKAQL